MSKQFCILIFLLTCRICNAQNLVPNPSFDVYDSCPSGSGLLQSQFYLSQWNIPLYPITPDYFNSCDTNLPHIYPYNFMGYQTAHTGSGYAGIITVLNIPVPAIRNYREYVQVKLTDTLVAGITYYVHWYVSAGDSSPYVSNNMGMYFSNVEIHDTSSNNYSVLSYVPQLENPMTNNLNDRIGWTKISGSYTASGGEKYIIIGNFHDTTTTVFTLSGWSGTLPIGRWTAYYYIDDVCVSTDSLFCYDSTIGINDKTPGIEITLSPNPFTDNLIISTRTNKQLEVSLYDVTSRKIFSQSFINSTSINTEQLAKGIYIYEVKNKNGVIKKGKVVKD